MSFPRYPKYKPSGVEWLGEVPEGWEVKRSDSFLTYSRAQLDPKDFQAQEVFHYSIPVVQETGTGQLEDGAEIASGKQVVKKKVVLVSKLNPRKGTICIAEPQQALTLCSTEFVALEPNGCDISYLSYLVKTEAFRQGLESKVTSVTNSHQRANPVDIYRFWNAWPVLAEQTAIAEFLDRETEKIDGLVAEQRRLMELLKEKRQAVISHAVSKGLNPHALMKPSGIEWLGDVPEHWEAGPLKRHITKVESGTSVNSSDEPAEDGKLGVLKTSCVYRGYFDPTENKTVVLDDVERVSCPVRAGTLIVSRMNTPELIGAAGLVVSAPSNLYLPDRLWQISFSSVDARFVHFWTLTTFYRAQVESVCTGTSPSMKNLGQDQFGCFAIAIPPLNEQIATIEFLDTELAKFDNLTAEAQRAIDLLQERRTVLISAAVTGQIDVRQHLKN